LFSSIQLQYKKYLFRLCRLPTSVLHSSGTNWYYFLCTFGENEKPEGKRRKKRGTTVLNVSFEWAVFNSCVSVTLLPINLCICLYTGWTQKHSLISSSYKIKTSWNIFINIDTALASRCPHVYKYETVDTALASRCPHFSQRALAKQMDLPRWTKWPGVLQVAPEITGPDRLW